MNLFKNMQETQDTDCEVLQESSTNWNKLDAYICMTKESKHCTRDIMQWENSYTI